MTNTDGIIDVAFYVYGESLNPMEITKTLGIVPTLSRLKGEKWLTSTGSEVTAKTGVWALDADREAARSFSDQVRWLRERLGATVSLFEVAGVQDVQLDAFIALAHNQRGGGDYASQLTPEDLAWLANIGARFNFTLTYTLDAPPQM